MTQDRAMWAGLAGKMATNGGVSVASVAGPSASLFLSKAEDCVRFKFGTILKLMIGLIIDNTNHIFVHFDNVHLITLRLRVRKFIQTGKAFSQRLLNKAPSTFEMCWEKNRVVYVPAVLSLLSGQHIQP